MNKYTLYILILISSTIGPAIPHLTLFTLNKNTEIFISTIYSFIIFISFFIFSYLLKEAIKKEVSSFGILFYYNHLSRTMFIISSIIYIFLSLTYVSLNFYLIESIVNNKIYGKIFFFIFILIFSLLILKEVKIESKYTYSISLLMIFLIISIFFISILSTDHKHTLEINIDPLIFSAVFFTSIFSGIEALTFISNIKNSKDIEKAYIIGTPTIYFLSLIFLYSINSISKSSLSFLIENYLIVAFTIFSNLIFYIWIYIIINLIESLSKERILPKIFLDRKFSLLVSIIIISTIYLSNISSKLLEYTFLTLLFYILFLISFIKLEIYDKYFSKKKIINIFLAETSLVFLLYILLYLLLKNPISVSTILILFILLFLSMKIEWKNKKEYIKFYLSTFYYLIKIFRFFITIKDKKYIESFVKDRYRILDYGAFDGGISIYLSKKYNIEVYASEMSKKLAKKIYEKSKNIKNYRVFLWEKDEIPKRFSKYFDLIIIYETLKYIIDIESFVKSIRRSIKDNGYILFITYVDFLEKHNFNEKIKKISKLLKEYGIENVLIRKKYFIFDKFIIIGKKK